MHENMKLFGELSDQYKMIFMISTYTYTSGWQISSMCQKQITKPMNKKIYIHLALIKLGDQLYHDWQKARIMWKKTD